VAKASASSTTNPAESIGVNLDEADRRVLVAACCIRLFHLGFKDDIGHWRAKAADLDWFELLHRAQELGVTLRRGNEPYVLPEQLTGKHGGH
jgi:hypothetical protein